MEQGYTINVLDKGYVRYIDSLGDDQRIVETARVCYKSPSKGPKTDRILLRYLLENQHTSPFESCNITFNIKMPIFVMRQFVRHRTFRLNEMSARYTEMTDDFYYPSEWRKQDDVNRQGSVKEDNFNPNITFSLHTTGAFNDATTNVSYKDASTVLKETCENSYSVYKSLINAGVAKEMARMILPVNLYTEIYVNCDVHNLMHFLKLRMDSHAQWEIRQYANAMYDIFKELYPWTAEAFNDFILKSAV